MGFLDHLFPPAASAAAPPPTDAGKTGRDAGSAEKETQFLHPKPRPPRLTPSLSGGAQARVGHRSCAPASTVFPKTELNPTPAASSAHQLQSRELVLTVGEILPHLPTEVIKPGLHDADALVRFDISDLSADIARGRATILLSKLADLCPELVHRPETESATRAIRLPLQKLVEQLTTIRTSPEPARVEPKPEEPPKESLPAQNTTRDTPAAELPLVEMHGDLVGHAASPVWLGPVRKNRTESKGAKPAEEAAQVKAAPMARGRRIEIAKPALPPPPTLA